ncbi:tryptophan synthase beta subunit-like PLP-dependent enzyme [Heliocybe sulcata]|uniref:L-serine ammonia-lyase n=1 Tax=Heliocybe sulcata TaxID=5364 RepID=A0A5C3NEF9_9AGAM|nr:tryptophan synthase beta subunit-like PLP-dependent enzyme [Heliocybe sulcata]
MTTVSEPTQPLWIETPLLYSSHISSIIGCSAYLKLENLQPSHSFKYRGVTHFIQECKSKHGPDVHCIIASGGNAGLAAACAARRIGVKCTVYIPVTASQRVLDYLKKEEAEVVAHGKIYAEALSKAKEAADLDAKAVMVPAYDDPVLWEGHASMVDEIAAQLSGTKPDAIFCSVGGGGLLAGIIVGCKRVGWDDVPIVGLETHGTSCFYQSMLRNSGRPVPSYLRSREYMLSEEHSDLLLANVAPTLPLSKVSCLAASTPSAGALKLALERQGPVRPLSIPDEMSMDACCKFADDHKLLVELACSTTLAPAYSSSLFSNIFRTSRPKNVVFLVCGGFNVSLDDMQLYKQTLKEPATGEVDKEAWWGPAKEGSWSVFHEDGRWGIPAEMP